MAEPKPTPPGHVPLLFGFRGIRGLQLLVAIAAGALAIAGVVVIKSYLDGGPGWLVLMAAFFGMLFIWLFGVALRLPTSFVAISEDRMRIRYAGFVDTVIETKDVSGARLRDWPLWGGLGVRTGFRGDVALVAAWGPVAEITLKRPIRVWLIPRLWRVRATKVAVSVRNPAKLVERFGTGAVPPPAKKKRR
ncbi:MAG: hypothetical protein IT301_01780 [Dehalococcoidia bacterium]|nr:hypothetical protein [Dehalococcoidia bacterium]